jgi:fatty acid desaturase
MTVQATLPLSSARTLDPIAAPPTNGSDMRELRRRVQEAGLLEPRPGRFALSLVVAALLLAAGIALLVRFHGVWGVALGAAFLGVVSVQLAYIVHDAGHRQGFQRRWQNALVGILCGDLLSGGSYSWWVKKHNEHHAHPNHLDMDPDIDLPFFAFTPEQALEKRGVFRFVAKHQVLFSVPLLTLVSYGQRIASIRSLRKERSPWRRWEIAAFVANAILYVGVPLALLGPWKTLLLVAVHQAVYGLYLGLVFAPNHKGMEMVDEGSMLDPVRAQVLTSRNVKGHPITDWCYGGLNYQIEHHLFPSMARTQLGKAQRIVRAFCRERGIAYHETSVVGSYVEILTSLHAAAAPLRAGGYPTRSAHIR